MVCYGRWGSLRQKPSPVADALLAHPNVTIARDTKRFDHAKLYVFDDETVILGSSVPGAASPVRATPQGLRPRASLG